MTLGIMVACGGGSGAQATPAARAVPTPMPSATAGLSGAVNGRLLFANKCSVCHGDNAAGGYTMGGATSADLRWARLADYHDDVRLVTDAIRNGKDQDFKNLDPVMPRWQGRLTTQQVSDVIAYLRTLTTDAPANQPLAAPAGASLGEVLFYQDCTVCHGVDGAGDKNIGMSTTADLRWPKLSDTYHNDVSLITRAILQNKDQDGKDLDPEMPRWQDALTPDHVQQVIAFLQTLK